MKKFVFQVLCFSLVLISSIAFCQVEKQSWDNWQLDPSNTLHARLAYFIVSSNAQTFIDPSAFFELFFHELPTGCETLGDLKKHLLQVAYEKDPQKIYKITPLETVMALITQLERSQDQLFPHKRPIAEHRSQVAITYAKTLAERSIFSFLQRPENSDFRHRLLTPLATLLKTDPSWFVRFDVLDPVLAFLLFEGSTFQNDILDLLISDPDYQVQLKLLSYFEKNKISLDLLIATLRQIIEEDENKMVRGRAQAVLAKIEKRPRATTASLDAPPSAAFAALEEPSQETSSIDNNPEPKTTTRIRKSTRRLQKPSTIFQKMIDLQKALDRSALSQTFGILPKAAPQDPQSQLEFCRFLQGIIYSETTDLYIRVSALELLYYFPDQMIPTLHNILIDLLPIQIRLNVLNTIAQDMPEDLIEVVVHLMRDQNKEEEGVRILSIKALAHCRDQNAALEHIDTLYDIAITDGSQKVRAEAIAALQTFGTEEAIQKIGAILTNEDSVPQTEWIQLQAWQALKDLSQRGNSQAQTLLNSTAGNHLVGELAALYVGMGLHTEDPLASALYVHQLALRLETGARLLREEPELVTDILTIELLSQLRGKEGETAIVAAISKLQKEHPHIFQVNPQALIASLGDQHILSQLRELRDPSFETLRPFMERVIETVKRLPKTP